MARRRMSALRAMLAWLAVTIVCAALASPAAARSVITDDHVATVGAAVQALDAADADAAGAGSARVRAFAARDARVEAATGEALVAWARADAAARTAEADAPSIDHLGPILHSFNPGNAVVFGAPQPPAIAAALQQLPTLQGIAFDDLYVATARAELQRLVASDKDYILNGDDETLRALAVHQLPKVEALLRALR